MVKLPTWGGSVVKLLEGSAWGKLPESVAGRRSAAGYEAATLTGTGKP